MKRLLLCLVVLLPFWGNAYTRQDTLRGSNGRGRDWWDVVKYDLTISIDTATRQVYGKSLISFVPVNGVQRDSLQIDLQAPLIIDSVKVVEFRVDDYRRRRIKEVSNEGNVWWVKYPFSENQPFWDGHQTILVYYHGKPREAVNPPWDGGFIWTKDSMGKPWISVACQGLGASSWWPCKDYQGDEPDGGMDIHIDFGSSVKAIWNSNVITNGRKDVFDTVSRQEMGTKGMKERQVIIKRNGSTVQNPINTYSTTFYIGDYAHWHDTLHGEKGVLDLDFYPLRYNDAKARKQWAQAKEMLRCFEWWMGPYPFYEDGYKLVEAPYLGMEHQSAIAYGNQYKNGYRKPDGTHIDRSGTGVGFAFDFIVVHESGHEWFGNNITARDIADNWLHEGFTTYTETLFAEWIKGKDSAFAYAQGQWKAIRNDRPVIGDYGVNDDGSSDKYDKGAAVVHMIRMMINDDARFRELLRGLNRDFYHRIVTSKEVEDYIGRFVGRDLGVFFDVYLRSTKKPQMIWNIDSLTGGLLCEWKDAPDGFCAPVILNCHGTVRTMTIPRPCYTFPYCDYQAPNAGKLLPCGWYDVIEEKR